MTHFLGRQVVLVRIDGDVRRLDRPVDVGAAVTLVVDRAPLRPVRPFLRQEALNRDLMAGGASRRRDLPGCLLLEWVEVVGPGVVVVVGAFAGAAGLQGVGRGHAGRRGRPGGGPAAPLGGGGGSGRRRGDGRPPGEVVASGFRGASTSAARWRSPPRGRVRQVVDGRHIFSGSL